jgi:Ca2+-binding RTX toxin-like protein
MSNHNNWLRGLARAFGLVRRGSSPARRNAHKVRLDLECFEQRTVPTVSPILNGTTLAVTTDAANAVITIQKSAGMIQVLDSGNVVGTYDPTQVTDVNVSASAGGNSSIIVDKSVGGLNATLTGGAGNDTLRYSGSGNATIFGGDGNDSITGGSGHSLLYGEGGNDTISGSSGSATIFGGTGSDVITGGTAGNNAIYLQATPFSVRAGGGSGNLLDASAVTTNLKLDLNGFQTVYGGSGVNTFNDSGSGDITIFGGAGNDKITGGSGHNVIYGVGGNDTLSGGLGSATIFGGAGADSITGGAAGNNEVYLVEAPAFLSAGSSTGNLLDASAVTTPMTLDLNGFQKVYGGSGGNTFTDSGSGDITIFGGTGDDNITGGSGHNVIYGIAGNDTLNGSSGSATIFGSTGTDSITGGAAGNNIIYLQAVPAFVTSGGGTNNILDASAVTADMTLDLTNLGFQKVYDGSGNNEVTYSGSADIILFGGAGNELFNFSGSSGHNLMTGGGGQDTMFAGPNGDTMMGGAGSVTVFGGDGHDSITGGAAGNNAIYLHEAPAFVDGGGGTGNLLDASAVTTDMNLTLTGFQKVYGGSGNDTLTVNGSDDVTIFGGAGNDSITGGSGHNVLYGEGGDNTLSGGAGSATIFSSSGGDVITGGTAGDNAIYLMETPASVSAGGGTGNLLDASAVTTPLSLDLNGFQKVYGGSGGNTFTDSGSGDITIFGGTGDDNITGGGGNNVIYGVAGNDTLSGGLGSATIYGGTGADSITGGAAGNNMIYLQQAPAFLSAGGGTGNVLDASAVTTDMNLVLNGFQKVYDGSGNDTLTYGGSDPLVLFATTGTKTIYLVWSSAANYVVTNSSSTVFADSNDTVVTV